jgi:hypothetical protein
LGEGVVGCTPEASIRREAVEKMYISLGSVS